MWSSPPAPRAGWKKPTTPSAPLGGDATLLPLDLIDGDALDLLGPSLLERFGRLDILVSNAASLGLLTPVPHILPKDWAEVVGVNLAAAWRLIRTCGPLLIAAEAGRAVFVTSGIVQHADRLLGSLRRHQGGRCTTWCRPGRRKPASPGCG